MFLSIVIPHYNLPRELLERCLQSIAALKLPKEEHEVIVVDDGSETAPEWAASFDTNIRLITAGHGGPGHARNVGITQSNGTYIMFVDADDYLLDNNEIFSCIERLKSERPQILRYGYVVEQEGKPKNKPIKKRTKFSNTISGATYMEKKNLSGSSWTFFFQRELVLKKGILFPVNIFHEDEEFNTIIHYHAQTLIESNAILYGYCIRNGSTTANDSDAFEKQRIADMLHIIERIHAFSQEQKEKSNNIQTRAITHKLDTLSVDVILNMLYIGMKAKEIREQCRTTLAPIGLYPLRRASYSLKYRLFRKLANCAAGMLLLRIVIPSKKPAKR